MPLLTCQGYRICDGVDILHNFFCFRGYKTERAGVYKKMGGKAMPKLPCSGVIASRPHRPEFCYVSQGFEILGEQWRRSAQRDIPVSGRKRVTLPNQAIL
jgi:hypothetical protein